MLRTRRQSAAAAEATGGGEVAALKQENERLRDLVRVMPFAPLCAV